MLKRPINILKKNRYYVLWLSVAFALTTYRYGLETAVLSSVVLGSMFGLMYKIIITYFIIESKIDNKKRLLWNVVSILFFLVIVLMLPERLRNFSLTFSGIIIIGFLLYNIVLKKFIK